jgi:hypothetical protein
MVTIAGPNRLLRIAVDPRKSDEDLIGTIGHELQHAIEVLSDHYVRSSSAAILRLKEICSACGSRYETDAAVKAGDAVRAETAEDRVVCRTSNSGSFLSRSVPETRVASAETSRRRRRR